MAIAFERFEALTFDCYGTLIDWERGILAAAWQLLRPHGAEPDDDTILEAFARHEHASEAGPFRAYRAILTDVAQAIGRELGVEVSAEEAAAFGGSVGDWPAFADSPGALARLAGRYRLGVITNCDDDLFAASARRLGIDFDEVVTAHQVGSYKPSHHNFEVMFERLGCPRERILHVAQSLFHDHVPAKALGLTTIWVDRRGGRAGSGATPPAEAVPDLIVPDLASLADLAVSPQGDV
ncbi:MAG TPA: haloacid dehalogenase type II [Candidatus Deferrimicrobium sp.]|nr:haloacid dehalogenase type II [Candidatus Deferrimicrobium sp.]